MRGRMCMAALLVLAPGCDFVFRLEPASLPGDGGAMGDDANDGGSDATFVPTAYIAAGDYDNDGILNPVDPCPLDPTTVTADSDADGLPDACDPEPNGQGKQDCIVLLETFQGAVDPRWKGTAGWAVADCDGQGEIAYCSPRSATEAYAYFEQAYSVARVTMEVRLRGVTAANTAGNGFEMFATLSPPTATTPLGVTCGLVSAPIFETRVEIRRNLVPPATTLAMGSDLGTFVENAEVTMTWTPAPPSSSTSTCRLVGPDVDVTTPIAINDPGRFVGLQTRAVDLNVHYVVAYGSTCPQ